MAIHPALTFVVPIKGDGVSTSITVDLQNDPVFIEPGVSPSFSPFDFSKNLPSSVQNVQSQLDGSPVTAVLSGKMLTLTFSNAVAADVGAQGKFLFD